MATEMMKQNLHEVIDIVDAMCSLQVKGIDSAIPFLRGEPGGGKTESIRNLAKKNGDKFLSCHFALKQPEDLGGIPQFTTFNSNGEDILSTKWSIPELLENLITLSNEAKKEKKKVIFFLDDIHRCGPFHITALFELLSERKIREIHIPDNVAIVLAGNGSFKAGAQLTNSAIINRCSVLDVQTNFDYWRENWAIPNNFNPHLLSFLKNEKYRRWFHFEEDINNPWPSPRSWSKLSNVLNIFLSDKKEISTDKIEYICQSHVGPEAAKDFIAYYQIMAKFNVSQIFNQIKNNLKKMPINQIIDDNIKIIQSYDELHQFAFSQAILIEFSQASSEERKKENYYDIISSLLIAFIKNPKNTFPEMSISVLKELTSFILKNEEKNLLKNTYNAMAKEAKCKTISETIDSIVSSIKSKKK